MVNWDKVVVVAVRPMDVSLLDAMLKELNLGNAIKSLSDWHNGLEIKDIKVSCNNLRKNNFDNSSHARYRCQEILQFWSPRRKSC